MAIKIKENKIIYSNAGSRYNQEYEENWDKENEKWIIKIKEEWDQYQDIQVAAEGASLQELIKRYTNGEIEDEKFNFYKTKEIWTALDTTKIPESIIEKENLKKELETTMQKLKETETKQKKKIEEVEKEIKKQKEKDKDKQLEKRIKEIQDNAQK